MNRFSCMLIRGGTSKGVFFLEEEMPKNREVWNQFLLDVMGSPDKRQIDGMGGGDSLTSKVAIIKKSERSGVDVEYTFAQVNVTEASVSYSGNCGNILAGIGYFALRKGLIPPVEPKMTINIYNTNTDKEIESVIRVKDGEAEYEGNCVISGVPGSGAEVLLGFKKSEGAVTGKVLPTGNPKDRIKTSIGEIEISIIDAANPLVFMRADELGLTGDEMPADYTPEKLKLIEEVRSIAAELAGFCTREEATLKSPGIPKATIISKPMEYTDLKNNRVSKTDLDVTVRMMTMQKPHQAIAVSCGVCIPIASQIEGTVVNEITGSLGEEVRLGHPGGIMKTKIKKNGNVIETVYIPRTARIIMEGTVYTKNRY